VDTAGLLKSLGTGGIDAGSLLNVVAVNRGGTGANSFTASRCVQINSSGDAFEAASGPCAGAGVSILDRVTTDTTVTNTASETSVYSFSVPGGTLATNIALRLTIFATYTNSSGSTDTFTVRLKYGATTVGTVQMDLGSGATVFQSPISAMLMADGATNAQLASLFWSIREDNAGNMAPVDRRGGTSSSEDSTAAKNFVVTVQHSVANSTTTFVLKSAILEKL
jgi:hypothetical protein